MFEESASAIPSSIWASMNNWFTPTVLFVLVNLVIGTIAFTSTLSNQKESQNDHTKISRSTSVLQRLKSINFYTHEEPRNSPLLHKPNPDSNSNTLFSFDNNTHLAQLLETESHYFFQQNLENSQTQPQSDFDRIDSHLDDFQQTHEDKVEENEMQSMDEVYSQLTGSHFIRTKSDTEPSSGKIPVKLPAKMRKSASMKSSFGHFEAADIVETRRPATVREKGNSKLTRVDEEVDAKADDFINKFKQQLKLQRLDSIIRYKDLIGRGSG